MHSVRRGVGSDVAGSRPYRPGDDVDAIDWAATARLSSARARDEFVVREFFAEEAPRVVVLCDRRPAMSIVPNDLPWLSKPAAVAHALTVISDSAVAARSYLGYLDLADERAFWRPPRSQRALGRAERERPFTAPDDTLARGLDHLARQRRDVPAGTFVFAVSDFLRPPGRDVWLAALARRWDVVPVVVQDPVWDRSFPDVSGLVVRFVDPAGGRAVPVALTAREARERRDANELRFRRLVRLLRSLDVEPVLISTDDARGVAAAFLAWADQRLYRRGRR